MRNIAKLTGIGVSAWFAGILTERYKNYFHPLKVDAAAPIKPSSDVPDFGPSQSSKSPVFKDRISQIMKFGFPGLDNVRSFDDYVLSYDRRTRTPHWVFEHLTRETVKYNPTVDRSKCDFFEDLSVHPFFRASNQDYKGSGYDRGHLAAAGNHRIAQQHVQQTFVLSNMSPQVPKFNREGWNSLEKYVRHLTKKYANVYVCTGPLYLPRREANGKNYVHYEVIGPNHVAVPTHFYKVVVGEASDGCLDLEAYIMPNQPIDEKAPLYAFQVPVEAIERSAGLIFFDQIQRHMFRQVNGRNSPYRA